MQDEQGQASVADEATSGTARPATAGSDRQEACTSGGDVIPSAAAPTPHQERIDPDFYRVDFSIHVSMRYHQARRAWWVSLNRMSSIAAALAGSAAVISVWGGGIGAAYVSAAAGGFAALNAALGFTDRAREHAELYRQFCAVASKMAVDADRDRSAARRYAAEVLLIEASEPPPISALNVVCHNQECEARNRPEYRHHVSLVNRFFKNVFTAWDDFPPANKPKSSLPTAG